MCTDIREASCLDRLLISSLCSVGSRPFILDNGLALISLLLVRLQSWARDKSLSFVPPDGRFTLCEYRYAPNQTASSTSAPSALPTRDTVPIPFVIKASVELGESGGMFVVLRALYQTHHSVCALRHLRYIINVPPHHACSRVPGGGNVPRRGSY